MPSALPSPGSVQPRKKPFQPRRNKAYSSAALCGSHCVLLPHSPGLREEPTPTSLSYGLEGWAILWTGIGCVIAAGGLPLVLLCPGRGW